MPDPRRSDYGDVVRDLERRVARLERTTRAPSIFIPSSSPAPTNPGGGGLFYVQAGSLHYIGSSGTDTTVAPA